MNAILKKMDDLFCAYLGLESEVVSPNTVEMKDGQLIVSNTESYKRHIYRQSWDEFSSVNLKQISQSNKEKLGVAVGKAIAKNLVVSFEEVQIKRE